MGIRDRPTSFRSPWQNGYAERLIGSIRRECTDHLIVLNAEHLRRILAKYAGDTDSRFTREGCALHACDRAVRRHCCSPDPRRATPSICTNLTFRKRQLWLTVVFGASAVVPRVEDGPSGGMAVARTRQFWRHVRGRKERHRNWLEIEAGLTMLGTTGHTELSGDIIFKKPFRISPTFEFMIGVGPSISRTLNGEDQSTTVSAAFTLDFMFWPTPNVGWFLEPTWTVNPRNGQQSFAASVGLLVGIRQR